MSDAMVMPEIGLAELPTWPQMREETVVKKKPKMMIRMPPSRLTPICGSRAITIASTIEQHRQADRQVVIGAQLCRDRLAEPARAHVGETRAERGHDGRE